MRVVFWNIQHGGGAVRTPELILAVLALEPDVVALAEFRAKGRGGTWRGPLADAGLTHFASAGQGGGTAGGTAGGNAVCVASKQALTVEACGLESARLLAATVGGVRLLVAHVPSEEAARARVEHFGAICAWARRAAMGEALLVGDLNASRRGMDVLRAGQRHEALVGEVWTAGLRDVWHEQGGSREQVSWWGPNGERHRLDTAMASAALLRRGVRMRYVGLRDGAEGASKVGKLSDHAGIVVEWGADASGA